MKDGPDLLVGLDLGTTKIAVVVAELDSRSGEAQIIGVGEAPSMGIRKGMIVNLDQATRSIQAAIEDAESMVGLGIDEVTVAFSGAEATSVRTKGMISLGRSARQVTMDDVDRIIEAAQSEIAVPVNRCILHTIPVEYTLDGHPGIDDPLDMTGVRLEVELQSIIVPSAVIQNVVNSVGKAGLEVSGLVMKPLASSLGCLSNEEAMAGVAVVDLGGGTTGVSVFSEGRPRRLSVIPVGGDHITNDLACVLRIPISRADALKKSVSLSPDGFGQNEKIEIESMGKTLSFSVREVVEVIACRLDELFSSLVVNELKESGISMMPGGVVLTGGVSRLAGLDAYVSRLLDMPVRVAGPIDANRMPPGMNSEEYSGGAGVIRYILEKERNPYRYIESDLPSEGAVSTLRNKRGARGGMSAGNGRKKAGDGTLKTVMENIRKSVKDLF
ncbi:MAG: cell division protein FtsA [Synergistales bacterium]